MDDKTNVAPPNPLNPEEIKIRMFLIETTLKDYAMIRAECLELERIIYQNYSYTFLSVGLIVNVAIQLLANSKVPASSNDIFNIILFMGAPALSTVGFISSIGNFSRIQRNALYLAGLERRVHSEFELLNKMLAPDQDRDVFKFFQWESWLRTHATTGQIKMASGIILAPFIGVSIGCLIFSVLLLNSLNFKNSFKIPSELFFALPFLFIVIDVFMFTKFLNFQNQIKKLIVLSKDQG
jgi:hypothetical protein